MKNRSKIPRFRLSGQSLPFYLLPVMIGLCGILLSRQFPNALARHIAVLFSVAVPLFTVGNIMARLEAGRSQRYIMAAGIIMLVFGGLVSLWDITANLDVPMFGVHWSDVPLHFWNLGRWIAIFILFLGLLVILYSVARREAEFGQVTRRFASLAEHVGEGFVVTDAAGAITTVNRKFLELLGVNESEVVGQNALELVRDLDFKPLDHSGEHKKDESFEYRFIWNKDGDQRTFWVSGERLLNRQGKTVGRIATFRDITDLERLSERLRSYNKGLERVVGERTQQLKQSEERLRDLLLHMSEGFLTVDASYIVQFANFRAREMLRTDTQGIIGHNLFDFVETTDHARLLELFERAGSREHGRSRHELTFHRRTGESVPVVAALTAIETMAENDVRFSLVVTDVGELKHMQVELRKRADELESINEELRQLDRAKDGFLTNVTHELRTPLSTVRGYIEMLDSESLGEMTDAQRDALEVIERNMQRLSDLIEEMLDFSRMQIQGVELSRTLLNPESIIDEACRALRPQAEQKNLTLKKDISGTFPPLWADQSRILQVLGVLLSNAYKFTPDGGTITVSCVMRPDLTATFSVADTGIGIDSVYHKRIFDKFYQIDSSLSRRYEGAGIGLAVAKSITEAHGGFIELESMKQKGSIFTVVLPHAFWDDDLSDAEKHEITGQRLQIVDDIVADGSLLSKSLEALGLQTVWTANTFESIRQITENIPDAVLLTDTTKDLACVAALNLLRENPATRNIPVLLSINENCTEGEKSRYAELCAYMIVRPYSARIFFHRLMEAIQDTANWYPSDQQCIAPSIQQLNALFIETDLDMMEWLEMALSRHHIHCRRVDSLRGAIKIAEDNTIDAVFIDIDSHGIPSHERLATLKMALKQNHCPVFATTVLPEGQAFEPEFDYVFRKPFRAEDIIEAVVHQQIPPQYNIMESEVH